MEKVVIVMPAWNEEDNISKMIEELVDGEFPKINAEMHLLVVDNHSKDRTEEIVKEASKTRNNVHIIQQGDKSGLGWAYISGFKYAMKELDADAVMEMDADFQHPPRFVKPMVEAYLQGADYVIGSRYIQGGSIPKEWALFRKAVSYFGNLFIRIVLVKPKIHDLTTGFRLTRVKGVLENMDLDNLMEPGRFAHKVDLLYQAIKNSKKTVEVPLEFASRTQEKSKFNTKEMIATFRVATILGIKDKARFIKFGTVGFAGYLVNAIALELFADTSITLGLANVFKGLKNTLLAFIAEPSAWAAAFAAELAIINNFIFNNIWTFKEKKITGFLAIIKKFLAFNLSTVGAIVIQFIVIGVMVVFLGDTRLIRQLGILLAMPLVLSYNYVMYNLFIWKTWSFSKFFKKQE
ncbi:MAG: Glycosyl transferase family 2 [Candidatus Woesebacteria bacterium GW2011_GWB1_39_12]|uniref:Glycosyl transferase family 2 n=2 Tax=Candidatus Woeseibacteriota TaxID=1752722 RepID=A0A0G0PH80_9BACT|nr:MAG: Glycosyl transferase family 2 [Candidatus Woesebacteria bacterium GW2011_GWA1_39_12]KKR00883.1 MAG: Glycosyl transferase family 2 [Candidatus Woesebacteria bacterium GW2011_GWB1_39_12]